MKAEEFSKKYFNGKLPKDKFSKSSLQYDYHNLIDFAESYHQSKIDAVTDEEIENHFENESIIVDASFTRERIKGAKWLKEKLKQ